MTSHHICTIALSIMLFVAVTALCLTQREQNQALQKIIAEITAPIGEAMPAVGQVRKK